MDELLTSDEVMGELKISRSTLGRLLAAGQIKAQRIAENGALRFKRADVGADRCSSIRRCDWVLVIIKARRRTHAWMGPAPLHPIAQFRWKVDTCC